MILDQITNAHRYAALGPPLVRALEFLQRPDTQALETGTYELDGRALYAIVQEYFTKPLADAGWEAHRRYADVQFIAAGAERIGYAPATSMRAGEYDAARDYVPLAGAGVLVTVHAGSFVILWPGEGHAPGLAVDQPAKVKKIVVKVRVEP